MSVSLPPHDTTIPPAPPTLPKAIVQPPLWLSIVVPTLNESAHIALTLRELQPWRIQGVEVIVVDGGSTDDTQAQACALADIVVVAPRGRASQLAAGAQRARGDALLFLHADSVLPRDAIQALRHQLSAGQAWGRFDVRITGSHPMLRVVAAMMNLRSRLTGIATGDQGIFVTRALLDEIGGVPQQALMEDVELSKRLRAKTQPACLRQRITTSGRRWEKHGVWRTIWLMWQIRFAYWRGADPIALKRRYET